MLPRWQEAFPEAECADASRAAVRQAPGLVWVRLDAGLPAAEQIARVRGHCAAAPIVVLSDQPSDEEAMAVFSAGVKGYCNSHAAAELLTQVALVVGQGGLWIGEGLMQRLLSLTGRFPAVPSANPAWEQALSERERDVAREIAAGASNKEIARRLGITERTVKMHVSAIFAKLKVRDRLQLSLLLRSQ